MTDHTDPAATTVEPHTLQTGDEVFDSLTGFEEIAIAQTFRRTVGDLAQNDPLQLNRALVFALMRRSGDLSPKEAYTHVQQLGTKAVRDYFAVTPNERNPADPATESGKDDSLSE